MDRNAVLSFALNVFGTQPDYPWADNNAVLRHCGNRKWYALLMTIGRDKLGLSGTEAVDIMNIKCSPLMLGSLLGQPGIHPAYHMSKAQWLTVRLDGSVDDGTVLSLLEMSYDLTKPKEKPPMDENRLFNMAFSRVYPLLVAKAERKGRTRAEVDTVTCWITGYAVEDLESFLGSELTYGDFFRNAPCLNPKRTEIKGKICGIRIETIEDPLMQDIRRLDKLVDDLAKGKQMQLSREG